MNRHWTPTQHALLAKHYNQLPKHELQTLINQHGPHRTLDALRVRARQYNLHTPRRTYTDTELQLLHRHYPRAGTHITQRILARHGYHRSTASLQLKASELGLTAKKSGNRRKAQTRALLTRERVYDTLKRAPYPLDAEDIAEQLRIPQPHARAALAHLKTTGHLQRDNLGLYWIAGQYQEAA